VVPSSKKANGDGMLEDVPISSEAGFRDALVPLFEGGSSIPLFGHGGTGQGGRHGRHKTKNPLENVTVICGFAGIRLDRSSGDLSGSQFTIQGIGLLAWRMLKREIL